MVQRKAEGLRQDPMLIDWVDSEDGALVLVEGSGVLADADVSVSSINFLVLSEVVDS